MPPDHYYGILHFWSGLLENSTPLLQGMHFRNAICSIMPVKSHRVLDFLGLHPVDSEKLSKLDNRTVVKMVPVLKEMVNKQESIQLIPVCHFLSAIFPEHPYLTPVIIEIFLATGQHRSAKHLIEHMRTVSSLDSEIPALECKLHLSAGNKSKALVAAKQCVELNPNNSDISNIIATLQDK